jgi:uncharacterized protein with FMN-binding domain
MTRAGLHRRERLALRLALAALAASTSAGCLGPAALSLRDYAEGIPISMPSGFGDGKHSGSYSFPLPPGAIAASLHWEVEVTTAGGLVKDVALIAPGSYSADTTVIPTLIQRIKDANTLDVDVVSGSTVSSKAFLKAVEDALKH